MSVAGYILKSIAAHPAGSTALGLIVATANAEGAVEAVSGVFTIETTAQLIASIGGAVAAVLGGVAAIINSIAHYKHGKSRGKPE